ncbi:RraA family protein [Pandoraea fibrosis]|uniref:Putative 4-hydroxy-4-methyl-2-oxoglutarate aldolase n=1 Tax=Pandoraea fibrosis TaxID=1891094 RepID=A0ABX6HY02_9BURK|nr:RraA family protein [Pandoraea fibrosis]QHE94506.1 RraA family protein [Pandoraea fibrosis]QHF15344.1 RraA family protein [Pandoraea fibrosis]
MNAPANAVSRLRKLDACAVSDALDKLGLPSTVSHLPQRSGARRIAGRAITVKLVAAADAPPVTGTPRHLGTTAVMLAGADDVIVVEQRTGLDAGSWGGILSLAAVQRGIAGVVADGPVRDIDEARDYDLPVFCRSLTARTARARVAEAGTNIPIHVDGFPVAPGDFVIADNSAVVFVSAANIGRVLDAAEQIAAREAAMAKALLAGHPVTEVMGANYEHMLRDTAA